MLLNDNKPRPSTSRAYVRSAIWSLTFAWRTSARLLAVHVLLALLNALVPALQVLSIVQLTSAATSPGDGQRVAIWIALSAALFGANRAMTDWSSTVGQLLTESMTKSLQEKLAETLANLPHARLADESVADEATRLKDSIPTELAMHPTYVVNSARAVITVLSLLITLWPQGPVASVFVALAALPTVLAFVRVASIESAKWPETASHSRRSSYLLGLLSNERSAVDLALLGAGGRIVDSFRSSAASAYKVFKDLMLASTAWIALGGLGSALCLALALVAMVHQSVSPQILTGGLVGVMSGLAAVSGAGYTFGTVIKATDPVAHFAEFVIKNPSISRPPSSLQERTPITVDVRGLSFKYPGANKLALDDVSFSASTGQLVAIVGKNGAGKSTLLQALVGHLEADQRIVWSGPSGEIPREEMRFSFMSQDVGHYELTIREAVALGSPNDVSDAEIWDALRSARADAFVRQLEGSLSAQLGQQWGGAGLSGGQWQRIALARVFLRQSPVLILDEATAAVDAETEAEIIEGIAADREDRITILVSHRAWTLKCVDVIYVLDEGRVVERGSMSQLLAQRGTFWRLFQSQTLALDVIEP